jgi:hypothetical protein
MRDLTLTGACFGLQNDVGAGDVTARWAVTVPATPQDQLAKSASPYWPQDENSRVVYLAGSGFRVMARASRIRRPGRRACERTACMQKSRAASAPLLLVQGLEMRTHALQ